MFGRYKTIARQLVRKLRSFESDTADLRLLLEIELELFRRLCDIERTIGRISETIGLQKKKLRSSRASKAEAAVIKRRIAQLHERRDDYRNVAHFWRSIGDALAFTLFDKFDLKPLAFKEGPGGIADKKGSRLERRILRALLARDIPAILCDVTNVIRYGDICIDRGNRPHPIEVKASKNRNARVDRQISMLKKLADYYDTDKAIDFYPGVPLMHRVAHRHARLNHTETMNEVIRGLGTSPFVVQEAEPGLVYFASRSATPEAIDAAFGSLCKPIMGLWNPSKFTGDWNAYVPFVKTIRDPDAVIGFAQGDFVVGVMIETAQVERLAMDVGYMARRLDDENWAFEFRPTGGDDARPYFRLSWHMLGRVVFECDSLTWLLREACVPPAQLLINSRASEDATNAEELVSCEPAGPGDLTGHN